MSITAPTFVERERAKAIGWKRAASALPDDARRPAPYIRDGSSSASTYDFCFPPEHAALNLLPDVRDLALDLFAELGIPWHASVDGGPSNHLLDSQVQCVNALGGMVHDPERIRRAFGSVLDIAEVLEVEPGRHLTFEFIGDTDHFGEGVGGIRTRGARCTSVDAAFLFRASDGTTELALVEWKYTESYRPMPVDPRKQEVRWQRYGDALTDPDGPVRADLLPFDALCAEPIYQLVRQQLLAWRLEQERALGADRVRVVLVKPSGNRAYEASLTTEHRTLGDSVTQVWRTLLRNHDRFVHMSHSVFADAEATSSDYVDRYGDVLAWDEGELLRLCGGDIEALVYDQLQFRGNVTIVDGGLRLWFVDSPATTVVRYPTTLAQLQRSCDELEERA